MVHEERAGVGGCLAGVEPAGQGGAETEPGAQTADEVPAYRPRA